MPITDAVAELGWVLLPRIGELDEKIHGLDGTGRANARDDENAARIMTIPAVTEAEADRR